MVYNGWNEIMVQIGESWILYTPNEGVNGLDHPKKYSE